MPLTHGISAYSSQTCEGQPLPLTVDAVTAHMARLGYHLVRVPAGASHDYVLEGPSGQRDRIYELSDVWQWWEGKVWHWLFLKARLEALGQRYRLADRTEREAMIDWAGHRSASPWHEAGEHLERSVVRERLPPDWMAQVEAYVCDENGSRSPAERMWILFRQIECEEVRSALDECSGAAVHEGHTPRL